MKKEKDFLIKIIGVLGVLLLVSIFLNIKGNMTEITGSAIQEKIIVCNENYIRFGDNCCLDLNKNLICDKDEAIIDSKELEQCLKEKEELQDKLKVFEEEKTLKEETCPVTCNKDEICVPVNKADGNVKWLCVDNPEHILGAS